MGFRNFLTELRRRKVWLVAGVYIVSAWVIAQVASLALPTFSAPGWVMPVLLIILSLGLPLAIILAWAQETQAAGDQSGQATSGPPIQTGGAATLAVLPFDNLSDDTEQEHLADGITEDVITRASRLPRLAVVARNSTFAYKGQNPDIREVGRELNAHYVLEGSLRKMGENVRITAQLIEAASGTHLWSENYDRPLANIFSVQDEVVDAITDVLAVLVREAEIVRARDVPIADLDDATLINRLRSYAGAALQQQDMTEYAKLMELALKRADRNPELQAVAALALAVDCLLASTEPAAVTKEELALSMAREAARKAPNDASVLYFAGSANLQVGAAEDAVRMLERSLEIAPNNALATLSLGGARILSGDFGDGIALIKQGMARDQHAIPGIGLGIAWQMKSVAEAALGNLDEAIEDAKESLRTVTEPGSRGWILAGYYDMADRSSDARDAARDAHLTWPNLTRDEAEHGILALTPETLHAPLLATVDALWDETA